MRKKIIASITTVGLVAGGGVAAAVTATPGPAFAQEETVQSPARPGPGAGLERMMGRLVAADVVTDDQADAITTVLRQLAEARAADRPERRPGARFDRGARRGFQLRAMLEDGVIDATELATLPEGHPFNDPEGPAAGYLDDGQLTIDELNAMREQRRVDVEARHTERRAAVTAALDGLVADGVITQDQSDAVVDALAKARRNRPNLGRRGAKFGFELAGMLADGVIDASELAQLPEGHPLANPEGPAAPYLEDGQLTIDELKQIRDQFRAEHQPTFGS